MSCKCGGSAVRCGGVRRGRKGEDGRRYERTEEDWRGREEREERDDGSNERNECNERNERTGGTRGTGLARGQRVAERGRGRVGSCGKWGCMLQNRDFFMVECTILRTCFDFYT